MFLREGAGTACGKRLPRGVERSLPSHGELDKDSQAPREYGLATVTWASVPTLLGQAVISNHETVGYWLCLVKPGKEVPEGFVATGNEHAISECVRSSKVIGTESHYVPCSP